MPAKKTADIAREIGVGVTIVEMQNFASPHYNDHSKLYEWQRNTRTSYVELQYHGKLDIDRVESMLL